MFSWNLMTKTKVPTPFYTLTSMTSCFSLHQQNQQSLQAHHRITYINNKTKATVKVNYSFMGTPTNWAAFSWTHSCVNSTVCAVGKCKAICCWGLLPDGHRMTKFFLVSTREKNKTSDEQILICQRVARRVEHINIQICFIFQFQSKLCWWMFSIINN